MATAPGTGTSVTCSVAPMLSVRQGARAVEFYKAAFGAVEVYRVEAPDGAVVSRLAVDGAAPRDDHPSWPTGQRLPTRDDTTEGLTSHPQHPADTSQPRHHRTAATLQPATTHGS